MSDPLRKTRLRRQLTVLDDVRAQIDTFPPKDQRRWKSALGPLSARLRAELAVCEGTETPYDLEVLGFLTPRPAREWSA